MTRSRESRVGGEGREQQGRGEEGRNRGEVIVMGRVNNSKVS